MKYDYYTNTDLCDIQDVLQTLAARKATGALRVSVDGSQDAASLLYMDNGYLDDATAHGRPTSENRHARIKQVVAAALYRQRKGQRLEFGFASTNENDGELNGSLTVLSVLFEASEVIDQKFRRAA